MISPPFPNFSVLNVTFVHKTYGPPKLVQMCSLLYQLFLLHNKSHQTQCLKTAIYHLFFVLSGRFWPGSAQRVWVVQRVFAHVLGPRLAWLGQLLSLSMWSVTLY